MGDIPQDAEDRRFARGDLEEGCKSGIYKEVSKAHAMRAKAQGAVISSAFVVWKETLEGRKGRFVVNLSVQSGFWAKGSVRMETMGEFASSVEKGDHFLSMDVEKGYRHLRLHPAMRDWFVFRYEDRYYQCIALPFGWGRSGVWFTQFMATFVTELRRRGWRVLAYVDDFLIAPSRAGVPSSREDCREAVGWIERLLRRLGIRRKEGKGEWAGAQRVEHLGVVVDSMKMRFSVTEEKADRVRSMARKLIQCAMLGKRRVPASLVKSFCGTCVSLSLAMPWARFYTRALYSDTSGARKSDHRGRYRLSRQSLKDLRFWKTLSARGGECERPIRPPSCQAALHTDAADMGYGATLNDTDLSAGAAGMWCEQGVWSWRERAEHITLRELKAVRRALEGGMGRVVLDRGIREVLLHVDNQAVSYIVNGMVSSSPAMMRELRNLKCVLDRMGVHIRSEWLPSAANRFADALSRRFPRGDLRVRRSVRRSIVDGMRVDVDSFPYRPLGEPPHFQRIAAYKELASRWGKETVRLLCPPLDLAAATVRKLSETGAPAILLLPVWEKQPWYHQAVGISSRVQILEASAESAWDAERRINPKWRLAYIEANM